MSQDGQPGCEPHAPGAIRVKTFAMAPRDTFEQHTHDNHQLACAASGVLSASAEASTWVLGAHNIDDP